MTCWKFWSHMNRNSLRTGQEKYCLDWLTQSQGSGLKHLTLLRLSGSNSLYSSNLILSLCIVSRPVTVWWTWTTWMAGLRSSIQTDWSLCSGRSGSSLPWAFPSQPRYNRLLILLTNSTDKPLSWNRWESRSYPKTHFLSSFIYFCLIVSVLVCRKLLL